jgi:hypothetical protein
LLNGLWRCSSFCQSYHCKGNKRRKVFALRFVSFHLLLHLPTVACDPPFTVYLPVSRPTSTHIPKTYHTQNILILARLSGNCVWAVLLRLPCVCRVSAQLRPSARNRDQLHVREQAVATICFLAASARNALPATPDPLNAT